MEDDATSPLVASFIDVLSCGLGGAVLLFLIFSVMPHKGVTSRTDASDLKAGTANELRERGAVLKDFKDKVERAITIIELELQGLSPENIEAGIDFGILSTAHHFVLQNTNGTSKATYILPNGPKLDSMPIRIRVTDRLTADNLAGNIAITVGNLGKGSGKAFNIRMPRVGDILCEIDLSQLDPENWLRLSTNVGDGDK